MSAELEVLQLVNPATQALLTAMMTDGWISVKERFAKLIARKRRDRKQAEAQLERSRAAILADPHNATTRAQIMNEWQQTFRELLINNPDIISPFRQLVNEISQLEATTNQNRIENLTQEAEVHDNATAFQQGTGNQFKIN